MYGGVSFFIQFSIRMMLKQYVEFSLAEDMLLILLSGATIKMEIFLLSQLTRWQGRFKGRIGPNHQLVVQVRRYGMLCEISKFLTKLKSSVGGPILKFCLQELIWYREE